MGIVPAILFMLVTIQLQVFYVSYNGETISYENFND